jgi:hypothetical protein
MPDFDRLYTHISELAELLDPGRREPDMHAWCIAVGERWKTVAEMWSSQPGITLMETELANLPPVPPESELQTMSGASAIERPEVIHIDARHAVIHQREGKSPRTTMCANCGIRYELTDDPAENHRRAYAHKAECTPPAGTIYGEEQRAQLLAEFHDQPMQRAFRERAAAALAAGVNPEKLKLTGVSLFEEHPQVTALRQLGAAASDAINEIAPPRPPRRWWQFWRWFE